MGLWLLLQYYFGQKFEKIDAHNMPCKLQNGNQSMKARKEKIMNKDDPQWMRGRQNRQVHERTFENPPLPTPSTGHCGSSSLF